MSCTFYSNAHVVTMDSQNTIAEAVLVKDGLIEAVGSTKDLEKLVPADAKKIDLKGMPLYPGFIDSHSHFPIAAMLSMFPNCGDVKNLPELFDLLKKTRKQVTKEEHPVFVYNLDDTALEGKRGPTRKELDAVISDKVVIILHISVHAVFTNSAGYKAMGINPEETYDNVDIWLDEDGLPNGKITEAMMNPLIMQFIKPPFSPELIKERLQAIFEVYNKQGFTSSQDGGLGPDEFTCFMVISALKSLQEEGKLNLRTYLNILSDAGDKMEEAGILTQTSDDRFIQPIGIKMVVDGSIQAHTGYFPAGYYDRPEHTSNLIGTQEHWEKEISKWHAKGYQISVHGNGTGAIEMIITAMEKAQAAFPRKDLRHIIVHCQTVTEDQLDRMQKLGIVPSFFGLHVWNWGDRHHEIFLGPERAARMNPCASAVRRKMPFSLHADTPVLPQMTMRSIHTAVNRETKKSMILGADQKISTEEAVKAYTTYAAYFSYSENWRGSIEAGKVADFVIPSKDILSCDHSKLKDIVFTATILDDRLVYGNLPK